MSNENLTPQQRLERIADLAQGLPTDAPALSLGYSPQGYDLIAGLPGAYTVPADEATATAMAAAKVGALHVSALRKVAARNPESGVILTELLIGLFALAACAVILIAAGPLYGVALLVFALCAGSIFRRPQPSAAPPVPVQQANVCEAPGNGVPVAVVRLKDPIPERPRRSRASGPHLRPRSERGSVAGPLLSLLGCAGIAALLAAAALSAMGCTIRGGSCTTDDVCTSGERCDAGQCVPGPRPDAMPLMPECDDFHAVMASKLRRHRCAMNAFQRGCDLGDRAQCGWVARLRATPFEALSE